MANSTGHPTPYSIEFGGAKRPDGSPYRIGDRWNGAYLGGNVIQVAGTRAFIDSTGTVQVGALSTLRFTLRR